VNAYGRCAHTVFLLSLMNLPKWYLMAESFQIQKSQPPKSHYLKLLVSVRPVLRTFSLARIVLGIGAQHEFALHQKLSAATKD
jgi:hypothetical protein